MFAYILVEMLCSHIFLWRCYVRIYFIEIFYAIITSVVLAVINHNNDKTF